MKTASYSTESVCPDWPKDKQYSEYVRLIAQHAPLRIEPGEWLAGASTLMEAAGHALPPGKMWGISHTTIGFEKALRVGYAGLRNELLDRLAQPLKDTGKVFVEAMLSCVDSAMLWHERNMEALSAMIPTLDGWEKQRAKDLCAVMKHVPWNPPRNFHEALQALWEFWEFQRLCGNWSGLGRIDKILGPFLERDLNEGIVTLDQARDMMAHFWIKGTEWIGTSDTVGSGDGQFYQNIVLSGIDEEGRDVTNAVTWLVLDIIEELHISDFPVAVRVNSNTDVTLLRRIAEVQRLGGGIVSIYNEEIVIEALCKHGISLREARNFTNDGCWEVLLPGKTCFQYFPFDALQIFQEALLCCDDSMRVDDIFRCYTEKLHRQIQGIVEYVTTSILTGCAPSSPLLSLWVEGCITNARGYYNLGPQNTIYAIHAGGLPDVINSMLAMKWLVEEKRLVSVQELKPILKNNWQGQEELRRKAWNGPVYYGNDDKIADSMARRVYDNYIDACNNVFPSESPIRWVAGISTFGREIEWRKNRLATAFGRMAGDILAPNLSPTPGTDRNGPTAAIKSFCAFDFSKLTNGVPFDLKLTPSCLDGEAGLDSLAALLKTFVTLGGWYLQINVVDSRILREAQLHPENHLNLAVRISGWSARFVTLSREWQDMIIQRTEHVLK